MELDVDTPVPRDAVLENKGPVPVGRTLEVVFGSGYGGNVDEMLELDIDTLVPDEIGPVPVEPKAEVVFGNGNGGETEGMPELGVYIPAPEDARPELVVIAVPVGPAVDVELNWGYGGRLDETPGVDVEIPVPGGPPVSVEFGSGYGAELEGMLLDVNTPVPEDEETVT